MFDYLGLNDYVVAGKEIESWGDKRIPLDRTNWEEIGISIAKEVSKRSPDGQTKVGSYITTRDHRPISTGFNGFPSGVDDSLLPNLRPDKYPYVVHSEVNSILNAARQGRTTENALLYCTHIPCNNCLLFIWQAGIREIIYSKGETTIMTSQDPAYLKWAATFDLITEGKMVIRGI